VRNHAHGSGRFRNLGKEYISAFEAIYPEVAKEENVGLIPFFLTGVATKPNLNQTDGIHPTAEGYQVVVEQIFPLPCKFPAPYHPDT